MTDENIEISRRTVLGALGTIGVTSSGAGLGTAAYFSDEEVFKGNHLTAGSLDLKLDWQEHYSDWSDDEAEFAGMADSDPDYVLPGGNEAHDISLNIDDEDGFMRATAVEAYPDTDNDGLNDYSALDEQVDNEPAYICNVGADTPEDLDPREPGSGGAGTGLRTYRDLDQNPAPGAATIDTGGKEEDAEILPLISLGDVKPGDFGEVTFSLHLCDNPGFVWMFADDVYWAENGHTEPERKDPDSVGKADESGSTAEEDSLDKAQVELLDTIRARAWYDIDGDNLKDDAEPLLVGPAPLRDVLSTLRTDPGILVDASKFFGIPQQEVTNNSSDTSIPDEKDFKCTEYTGNPSCEDVNGFELGVRFGEEKIKDGEISKMVTVDGTDYKVFVDITVVDSDGGQPKTIQWTDLEVSIDGGQRHEAGAGAVIVKGGPAANVCTPVDPMEPASGAGDQEFHAPEMDNGNVPAISHLDFCIAEIGEGGDNGIPPTGENGDPCLPNSTTVHVGFEWWLPIDHGNEVQTDSVAFDLGFYTEQCRHNGVDDGNGTGIVEDGDGDGTGPAFSFIAYCGVDTGTTVTHTIKERDGDGDPIKVSWSATDDVQYIRTKSGKLEEEFDVGGASSGTITVGEGTELKVTDTDAFASDPCHWNGGSADGVKYEYDKQADEFQKD